MESRISFDLHTHTVWSHGKGSIADNAAAAASLGLERLGISDHGPGNLAYGVDMSLIPEKRREIEALKAVYPGLKIELGIEANIVNINGELDITKDQASQLDFIIAGYHYSYLGQKPFKGIGVVIGGWLHERGVTSSVRARNYNTDFMVNTILANKIDILSHPGDKADFDIGRIAKACEETGCIMEINDHHNGLSEDGIREAMKHNVRFIVSSDAHRPDAVGRVDRALQRAELAGLDLSRIVNYKEK